jgi:nucleoside-diphosphate-sugar epimerase
MQKANIALVTGATGFVGSALVKRLLKEGFEVRALSSGTSRQTVAEVSEQIEWFPLSDEGVAAAIPGVTHFFNFAVIYDRAGISDEQINEVNVVMPMRILAALETCKNPVVCVLGDSFYRKYPYNATAQGRYTRSKDLFAKRVLGLVEGSNNCFAMLLIEQVYGPGEKLEKAYPRVIRQLLGHVPRVPLTHGQQRRDFIHIADVIDSILVTARSHWSGVIDVGCGSGTSTPVRAVFEQLKVLTGSPTELGFGDIPSDQSIDDSTADIRWLQKQGWSCKISLEAGLKDFVDEVSQRCIERAML